MNVTYPLCYAQRMLNPFHGAMHIVKLHWSEGVTTDGVNWTLYIRGERFHEDLQDEQVRAELQITVPDIKYGTWSAENGLHRSPIRLPTFYDEIELEGQALLQAIMDNRSNLPFDFGDCRELWLLDEKKGEPLALIGSCCRHETPEEPPLRQWNAGMQGRDYDPLIGQLQDRVNQLAGKKPDAVWLDRQQISLPDHELNAGFLEDLHEALDKLTEWQSPFRLLLGLDEKDRRRLEKLAARDARRLLELAPLYPAQLDESLFTAARVELRMRDSLQQQSGGESGPTERSIAPFYLELGD